MAAILANGFSERGIKTELLVCAQGGQAENTLKAIAGDKVNIHFFRQTISNRIKELLFGFRKMGKHLQSSRLDIVLASGNQVSMFSLMLSRIYCSRWTRVCIKTINPVLLSNGHLHKRIFRRLSYSIIFRICDDVLTLTDSETTFLNQTFSYLKEKLVTVSNPYITHKDEPVPDSQQNIDADRSKLIIAVGRMSKQKRLDILLQAFSKVSKKKCRLPVLEEDEDRSPLEEQ